jgi:5-methylcytosine-specific restriction enzyme A
MASWPYSTQRWQRLRAAHLSKEPWCRYCASVGVTTVATVVDHVIPVREARDRAFDPDNLQSLCDSCHSSAKQREDAGGELIGCNVSGIPFRGWE